MACVYDAGGLRRAAGNRAGGKTDIARANAAAPDATQPYRAFGNLAHADTAAYTPSVADTTIQSSRSDFYSYSISHTSFPSDTSRRKTSRVANDLVSLLSQSR
jgi:hypothetical protein